MAFGLDFPARSSSWFRVSGISENASPCLMKQKPKQNEVGCEEHEECNNCQKHQRFAHEIRPLDKEKGSHPRRRNSKEGNGSPRTARSSFFRSDLALHLHGLLLAAGIGESGLFPRLLAIWLVGHDRAWARADRRQNRKTTPAWKRKLLWLLFPPVKLFPKRVRT